MIDPGVHLNEAKKHGGRAGKTTVAIRFVRCVAVAPPRPFAVALSPWSGGLFHPRLTIPPDVGLRPVNLARRAFVPSMDLQTRDVPPVDPDEGPCPCDPRDGRAALTHPAQPCRLDAAYRRVP
jgi:hypothetical protein